MTPPWYKQIALFEFSRNLAYRYFVSLVVDSCCLCQPKWQNNAGDLPAPNVLLVAIAAYALVAVGCCCCWSLLPSLLLLLLSSLLLVVAVLVVVAGCWLVVAITSHNRLPSVQTAVSQVFPISSFGTCVFVWLGVKKLRVGIICKTLLHYA